MRERSISALGIVILGLVPALVGGVIFAFAFTVVTVIAYRELLPLLHIRQRRLEVVGYLLIGLAGFLAWLYPDGRYLPLVVACCMLVPLTSILHPRSDTRDTGDWATCTGAVLYLMLPTFAAIALRGTEGSVDRQWFQSLADAMPSSGATAEGLGLFLTALLITWLSDTAAYLVGKSVGRTKLIPRVSPNKTVEGAIGGLIAAGTTSVVCVVGFGLDVHPLTALIVGILIGATGMVGDLSESMLKRRAGVKDSGNLIPGHGGMLDRIDALIFVVTVTWALLPALR
ncbi:MAG TPA: phosphatidate cytidylyltransferase [Thermomicrobiales bacterium]|nr:phosphatidate cytidylyltransferase [Thermomicrobiales bacterium]